MLNRAIPFQQAQTVYTKKIQTFEILVDCVIYTLDCNYRKNVEKLKI